MRIRILGMILFLASATYGCKEAKAEKKAFQDQLRQDSIRKEDQLRAWRTYAEDMYYYRMERRSTFAPVSANDPQPMGPPYPFSEEPAQASAPMRDEPADPIGAITMSGESIRLLVSKPLVFPAGKDSIQRNHLGTIGELVSMIGRNQEKFRVSVVGYATEGEAKAAGLDEWTLSTRRATSVLKALISGGVSPYHLEAVGRGSFSMSSDSGQRSIDVFLYPIQDRQ